MMGMSIIHEYTCKVLGTCHGQRDVEKGERDGDREGRKREMEMTSEKESE